MEAKPTQYAIIMDYDGLPHTTELQAENLQPLWSRGTATASGSTFCNHELLSMICDEGVRDAALFSIT